jgi:hypothetical protein
VTYLIGVANAADKTLSLVSSSGQSTITVNEGDPIAIEVHINDASAVAGASFTVTYDTTNLTLTNVESAFFGTFVSQSIPTPLDQGYVTVDSTNYYSPIVDNSVNGLSGDVTTGSMLAAARVDNGTGLNGKLFTLHFTLTGAVGSYPINIIQSKINNVEAGYSAEGDLIPLLVGIDDSTGTYPTHNVPTVLAASLIINSAGFVDNDTDDIDDSWETDNAPDGTPVGSLLTVFSKFGDYDNDGYSDYQEYLNRNITDPEGAAFDPTAINAAGGEGYIAPPANGGAKISPILFLLLESENK